MLLFAQYVGCEALWFQCNMIWTKTTNWMWKNDKPVIFFHIRSSNNTNINNRLIEIIPKYLFRINARRFLNVVRLLLVSTIWLQTIATNLKCKIRTTFYDTLIHLTGNHMQKALFMAAFLFSLNCDLRKWSERGNKNYVNFIKIRFLLNSLHV